MRFDKYIVETQNCTRNRAQFFIEQKLVFVNDTCITKTSYEVKE